MEVKFSQLAGINIRFEQSRLGSLKAVFVENQSGKITGITNKSGKFFSAASILSIDNDILLSTQEDRDNEGDNWIGFKVRSMHGRNFGIVDDLWIDQNGLQITRISVCKSVFGIKYSKRIFSVNSIYQVVDRKIIIDDDLKEGVNLNFADNISMG